MTKRNARGYANRKRRKSDLPPIATYPAQDFTPAALQAIKHPRKHRIIDAADVLSGIGTPKRKRRRRHEQEERAGRDKAR